LHAVAKIAKFAKNWKNRRVSENQWKEVEKAPTRAAIFANTAKIVNIVKPATFAKTAKIANILKSAKNWKIRQVRQNL